MNKTKLYELAVKMHFAGAGASVLSFAALLLVLFGKGSDTAVAIAATMLAVSVVACCVGYDVACQYESENQPKAKD